MATPFTPIAGSASISGTEFSLPNGSTTLTPQTTAINLETAIDFSAMLAGDQYRIQLLDKVNGGSQIVVWEAFATGATPQAVRIPAYRVNEGWDVRVKLIQGSARTIGWSLKEDVGGRAAETITAGAISSSTFASGAITSTVIAANAIGASQIATDAIDADALKADAVTEIQAGLALAATALSTAQWTNTRAGLIDNLDAAVTTRAPASTAVSTANLTTPRIAALDNLDAAVTSRSSAASLATATAAIAAVQADTDDIQTRIPASLDGAGNMKAGVQTIAANAITAAAVAADALTAIAAAVWGLVSEGAETVLHQLRLLRAREVGKATVQDGDGTYSFRDALDTKTRLVMTKTGTARTTTTADGT